jgi:hypothetical protein
MTAYRQSDSDPLPYVQVDRAAKPKAALLAGKMGVSNQHALGSLVEWWDLCGDPRDLERVVESTPEGQEPERLLTRAEVELRFELASGHTVTAETLAAVGLLEPRGEAFRVRGMSRYFAPVQARVRARKQASAGGKARAQKAQRDAEGRLLGAGALAGSTAGESAGSAQPEPSRQPADSQPTASPSGQRSAVSGHLLEEEAPPPTVERAPVEFIAPTKPPGEWLAEDFFAWAQSLRQKAGLVGERRRPPNLGTWWSTCLMTPGVSVERMQEAFLAFGDSPHWQQATPPLPFRAFVSQWDQFLPREVRRAS